MNSERGALGFRTHLRIEDGQLKIGRYPSETLAERYGTPLYVLDEESIRSNYRALRDELSRLYSNVLICPAYKANSHLAVSRIYQTEGAGAEVVSPAELRMAMDTGVERAKIVYNGPVKKTGDLEFAISSGVGLINADSTDELEIMDQAAAKVGRKCNVGIRVNLGIKPDIHPHLATAQREHKFGVWVEDALEAYRNAVRRPNLNVVGAHCHIGSSINQPSVFREMAASMFNLACQIDESLGLRLTRIDFGGGIGFQYQPEMQRISFPDYAGAILTDNVDTVKRLGNPLLLFEPGRAIIADTGVLLTRVEVTKRQGDVNWAIVDAGMNTFIRPSLYGAKHQVLAANKSSKMPDVFYDVGGPCCESADVIARDCKLPKLSRGDLLAVLDVGAYGYTMSSNYNGQPKPAVILIADGKAEVIRRRQNYEDLFSGERIPPHLAG